MIASLRAAWLAVVLLAVAAAAAAQALPGAWLDAPLQNWNAAGASVPPAPRPESDAELRARCAGQARPAGGAADRAVAAAGWTLFGALQVFGDVSVRLGYADVDGMCRPLAFQGFVFVGERFAGTISPILMNARTDGVEAQIILGGPANLYAEFSRYAPTDPMCCPTRISTVSYALEGGAERPLLVPVGVSTRPVGN